jgi:hypothetical protein
MRDQLQYCIGYITFRHSYQCKLVLVLLLPVLALI